MKISIYDRVDIWAANSIDIEISGGVVNKSIAGKNEVTFNAKLKDYVDFKIGSAIQIQDGPSIYQDCEIYVMNKLPSVTKVSSKRFEYSFVFQSLLSNFERVSFRHNDESSFAFTGRAQDFITILLACVNAAGFYETWTVNHVETTVFKTIEFKDQNCLGALTLICDEFDLEYEYSCSDLNYDLTLSQKVGTTTEVQLEYGLNKGLYNIARTNVDSEKLITRLYYQGSDKNVPSGYGSKYLKGSAAFVESNVATFGLFEASKTFEDIYPTRVGSVSGVEISEETNTYYIYDSAFPFDLKAKDVDGNSLYLVPWTTAKISFRTGNCAGNVFEITNYKHSEKRIEIVPMIAENGYKLPNATVQPAIGDEYVIYDINLPTAYITSASESLDTAALAYLQLYNTPRVSYTLKIDPAFMTANFINFKVGDMLTVIDADLNLTAQVRVLEMSYPIDDTDAKTVKLSDVRYTSTERRKAVEAAKAQIAMKSAKANDPQFTQKSMKSTGEVMNQVFDYTDNKIHQENIKVEGVDPVQLALDASELQFHLEGVEFTPNFEDNPDALHVSAGTFVHHSANSKYRSEIEAIQAAGGTYTPFRSWNIAETTFSLSAGEQHIYAKVHSSSDSFGTPYTDAEIVLSSVPLWAKKDVGYTYFRIGSISDVDVETDTRATKTLWPKVEKSAPGAKNFIELQDADSTYPANGNVVKGAPDGVPFAENLGDDGAVWVRSQLSETLGANLGFTSSTALEAGKTYQIMVIINGRTVGSVAIKINSSTIATVTQTAFIAYTAASTGAHNCEAVASVDFDGTISLITIKEVIAVSRKGLKFVDGAHGTIAELLAFADNLAWGATLPADFAGSGNIYIGASPESGDESNKVRLAEVLYDRMLKLLTLKGTIELNKDTDNEYKLPETTPEIATGEESKKFAMTRTGDTAALGWFELLEFISRATIESGAVGNVPRIVEVGGVRNVTWGAALAPTSAPSAPSVAIYAADGSITYVGYQHATEPTFKRAKVLSTDAYDALVTAGTVDANVIYLQYEES